MPSPNLYDPVEQKIVEVLADFSKKALKQGYSDAQWTKGIKEDLGNLGVECGFEVCTSGMPDKYSSEWLFDMTWYKNDEQSHLLDIPLVVESEWSMNFDQLKYDFEKLLTARSSRRLFIYQSQATEKVESVVRQLITGITKFRYSQLGDRYLFAGYNWEAESFNFRLFVY